MYIIVSRRKTLHHTRKQESSHFSWSYPPLGGEEEGNANLKKKKYWEVHAISQ